MRLSTIFFLTCALMFSCSNPCDDINCGPNGTCDEESESCICDEWYFGTNCENEMRTKFLGTWSSSSQCILGNTSISNPTWEVTTSAIAPNSFVLQSPDVYSNMIINATMTSETEADMIPFTNGGTNFTGSISFINESALVFNLNFTNTNQNVDCTYSMFK